MDISIEQYNYSLPDERIAKYPLKRRDHSRLLFYKNNRITDKQFYNLPDLLPSTAMMIFNNTKVIRARLPFHKHTGARVEIFCLEPASPTDVALAFGQTEEVTWNCMVGNNKKWKVGTLEKELQINSKTIVLKASKEQKTSDGFIIRFSWNNSDFTFSELMEEIGKTPIPPYLERESEEIDTERYQTVYSKAQGSVAAPTAGLHFTPEILENLKSDGIKLENLTLHVGAGTFRPVKSETIADHEMHTEHFRISLNTLKSLRSHRGPKISVGTTSLRTLESLYWAGALAAKSKPFHHIEQWTPYNNKDVKLSFREAIDYLISAISSENKNYYEGSTAIIIVPGYQIRAVDGLLTNFHQPKSTLLLLVAALVGEKWKEIYKHALENDYRFLSYGDSSLLWASTSI
ncbi:S-adenosylmethionine:tRNA ribosyltransferase-isomerase [Marinilabilia rubra]|uniref:S-adenosylmethionine:tRNA ribosyltransferase-isomerase n=1 Tax=Marinilabilia rubra TaxID=2162893 RepID=A0A2U2BCJ2_9BACT|nr:S-adenosylmethionine:tRNA ribosyltransferase-isomerase [Marinilabilia rubra]PWE00747.1 S-adenosylmethionine tRNA ribosyltransferase [Marinilabilia rubra]